LAHLAGRARRESGLKSDRAKEPRSARQPQRIMSQSQPGCPSPLAAVAPSLSIPAGAHPFAAQELQHHVETQRRRVVHALWVYRLCLSYTVLTTAIWLFLLATGRDGGWFFGNYQITLEQVGKFAKGFAPLAATWWFGFFLLKLWLLRRAGLNWSELRIVFSSRLRDFDLEALLRRHSERTLRIIDMIGRRGRNLQNAVVTFGFVIVGTGSGAAAERLAHGLNASVFDAMILSWLGIVAFRSNGLLGWFAYGAQSRILDGIQGRANALCISTFWNAFKFVMVPLGLKLAGVYPSDTYVPLYALIWLSYVATDYGSEIFGSIFGRQRIRVWGLGDVNRKSWAGVLAGFLCALVMNLAIVLGFHLSGAWLALGLLLAIINPIVELYSPRGTDDFTMATTNALICLGYGWLVFSG